MSKTEQKTAPRILVLFGSIPLYGQERGNIEALRAVREATGAEVLFVTHEEWGHQVIQPELDRLDLPWTVARYAGRFEKGMGIRRWVWNLMDMLVANWQLAKIAHGFRPTHIHVGNPAFFLNFLPWLLLHYRVPLIYRTGDKPSLHNVWYRILWRLFIIPRTTHFVANSFFIEKGLLGAGTVQDKVRVIYSRPPLQSDCAQEQGEMPPSEVGGMIFLYVGQISQDKGVDILVEAARLILKDRPGTRFWVAGDYKWRNPLAEELMAKIQKDGLEKSILFLGYRNDVSALYAKCDVHICPSVCDEALANVVLEAKHAGKPSIIFPSGGLPELIRHGIDGYCCQENTTDDLAEAIQYYLERPEKIIEHGVAARRSLDEILEVEQFPEKWAQVYYDSCRR